MSDDDIIGRIDAFCDAVPRQRARTETIGSLVLFIPVGPGYPYYARPRAGRPAAGFRWRCPRRAGQAAGTADTRVVRVDRAGRARHGRRGAAAGLRVHEHPLLVLDSLHPPPPCRRGVTAGILGADDPDVVLAWSVPAVAFGHPGTDIGEAGVTERDKIAADHDAATIAMLRERLRAGQSVLAAASGPNGPLAAGSYQLAGGVAEITGIGVLPASRRRGLGGRGHPRACRRRAGARRVDCVPFRLRRGGGPRVRAARLPRDRDGDDRRAARPRLGDGSGLFSCDPLCSALFSCAQLCSAVFSVG